MTEPASDGSEPTRPRIPPEPHLDAGGRGRKGASTRAPEGERGERPLEGQKTDENGI